MDKTGRKWQGDEENCIMGASKSVLLSNIIRAPRWSNKNNYIVGLCNIHREMQNATNFLLENLKGRDPKHKLGNNVKMDLWEGVD